MAYEQYLISRQRACYKSPLTYKSPKPTPDCNPDKYTNFFRKRWNALAIDPCKKKCKDLCNFNIREECKGPLYLDKEDEPCVPSMVPTKADSLYRKDFAFPRSHNVIDDCCKAPCPCDPMDNYEMCIPSECKVKEPSPPLDDMTTHRYYFTPKPTPCPPQRRCEPWVPNNCPLDEATSYRLDYQFKKQVPNGPVPAAVRKHGMWSIQQFSEEPTAEETEYLKQYPEKCRVKRMQIPPRPNLAVETGPFARASETCYQYGPKEVPCHSVPSWVLEEPEWVPPCPPKDDCTVYNHFYRPWELPNFPASQNITNTPKAIPFPTVHNMWYTCCDPKVDQRPPVEIKDNDPWPYVRPCPIRYQDNLQTDPCAPFRDDTTHKADFTPKRLCIKLDNFDPRPGYTPPIQPMNDDTTNRVSFRAYNQEEYRNAFGHAGNLRGRYWGPFKCPPNVDKCLPRFPAPYGHPLKPFTKQCPCGPFDDRSTYHNDFKFRSKEMVQILEDEMCRVPNVEKGVSLSRFDYVDQAGKKAKRMPPPEGKGHRCINPSSRRDTDTLYRTQFRDFYQMEGQVDLNLYRGKRTDPRALKKQAEAACECADEGPQIIAMPEGTTVEEVLQSIEESRERNKTNN